MAKKTEKEILTFHAVFLEEDDGGYSVSVPALPGCFSQGETSEDAVINIKEAIGLYLEDEPKEKELVKIRSKKEFMAPVELYA
jgi:antitoxin HicB